MGKEQELIEASRKGNTVIVEKILGQRAKISGPLASLRRGPGPNTQDSSGYSPLHHAALNGHPLIVRLLLEHDATPNIVDYKGGATPLHLAAWSGHLEIVKLLLTGPTPCNVNSTTQNNETALHYAAQYGHTAIVAVLLEYSCDPGIRNIKCETALDLAALYGRLETVELLVKTDPNFIQRSTPDILFHHTPLHLASRNGHKAVVEVLLRAGFNVNLRTKSGTALHEAALHGKVEVVRTLLEHGVNTSIRDFNNFTVMDILRQFNNAQAAQDIIGLLKRHNKRVIPLVDSDSESISIPFPLVPNTDSDLGSPYENVRPSLKTTRSIITDSSPSTSPQRWDQKIARPPEGFEDRRISGISDNSLNGMIKKSTSTDSPLSSITFSFSECSIGSMSKTSNESSTQDDFSNSVLPRDSDIYFYQIPSAPKQFMDSNVQVEDLNYSGYSNRESDQISLSSTASSVPGYTVKRPDSSTSAPLYMPMNKNAHSPGSANKVSPTPPKKPPRRSVPISPTHLQPMSASVDGVTNDAYEYLYFAHSGTRSQNNLNEIDPDTRRDRLLHGHSMDQYVEMNIFANDISLDDEPIERPRSELQRGKSEELDNRKKLEPVAITSLYENTMIKQQNPRRKLRRHNDVYEDYDLKKKNPEEVSSSSAPERTFISRAYLMLTGKKGDGKNRNAAKITKSTKICDSSYPLSPTHYNQPPTPEHPPPSALQAENIIHEKIRPLSQEYKRRSRDMETEIEEEYLLIGDHESTGSFSSSVSLSDRSVDNILEEYHSDTPYSGLIKGSASGVLENLNMNVPAVRPKTLKKLKRFYENSPTNDDLKSDNEISSSSEKESDNKENRDNKAAERVSALSPFDEQEEWAKIQEIMASFGTGIVRESVFVAELEKEFQNRLMTISCSQNSLNNANDSTTVEKWLQKVGMVDYSGLFMSNGFDDVGFLNGVLDDNDLIEMGISNKEERDTILEAIKQLPLKVHDKLGSNCNNNDQNVVKTWLSKINLEHYFDTFNKHLYHDMERIKRIWDVELSAVLDIEKLGHRKRILASVSNGDGIVSGPKLEDIGVDSTLLKNGSQSTPEITSPSIQATTFMTGSNTGTIRHRHKKSRPAPQPPVNQKKYSEIIVGGCNSIKSKWRHQPILLITGSVKYSANYWGSTTIKEFKGTDSTKKSIQKVMHSKDHYLEEIVLSISYKGVKFINPSTQNTICEHEIVNMNCACQDDNQQTYFAYITKDNEMFYCHVFQAATAEFATDIILTLGQAFELAYQMALRDHLTNKCKTKNESSSSDSYNNKSAASPGSISLDSREFKDITRTTDIKMNGHPLKIMPLTLSIATNGTTVSVSPNAGCQNEQNQKTLANAVSNQFSA